MRLELYRRDFNIRNPNILLLAEERYRFRLEEMEASRNEWKEECRRLRTQIESKSTQIDIDSSNEDES